MKSHLFKTLTLAAAFVAFGAFQGRAQSVIISEVHPSGSGNGTYAADFFELTNTGALALDITGWTMDDSSAAFATSVALRGVTSIDPGESVVFLESASLANDPTVNGNFTTAWFGGSPPAGLTLGNYGGSGVGLSTSGDAVNIYDSLGNLMANVSFGASTTGVTFDNAAGLNNATISTLSIAGVNGAFVSSNGAETGSPCMVPEPASATLLMLGLGVGLLAVRRFRK